MDTSRSKWAAILGSAHVFNRFAVLAEELPVRPPVLSRLNYNNTNNGAQREQQALQAFKLILSHG